MGGNPSHCHLQQQELSASVCRLCQLCAEVRNSHRFHNRLQAINIDNPWTRQSVFVVIENFNVCMTASQWHRGGENDLVSGADC